MARGGRVKRREGPERRCIATGESGSPERMVRFVLGPEGEVVPDVAGRLPGRGVWVTAERAALERALAKRLFARAFRAPVRVPEDLADRVEALLARRLVETISMARRAGRAVTGFEKVRARLREGRAGVLVEAREAARHGREKLARLAGEVPVVDALAAEELGLAFGRDFAIHAALDRGSFADRVIAEGRRLAGFRSPEPAGEGVRAAAAPVSMSKEEAPEGARQGD